MLILFILIILFVYYLYNIIMAKRIPSNTVLVFTGTMGSGKSFLGVKQTIKHYRKMKLLYLFRFIDERPQVYSNIPIFIGRKYILFGPPIGATILTMRHITGLDRMSQYCSLLWDEVGDVADQYSYNNPFVVQFIQGFIRFGRHYLDPQFVLCTQSVDDIAKPIRTKISQVYHLSDFRRVLLYFYKVTVREIAMIEDTKSIDTIQTELEFFFGFPLPFKYVKFLNIPIKPFSFKYYDSRCYSIEYNPPMEIMPQQWKDYKTTYHVDIPKLPELDKLYKLNGIVNQNEVDKILAKWEKVKTGTKLNE